MEQIKAVQIEVDDCFWSWMLLSLQTSMAMFQKTMMNSRVYTMADSIPLDHRHHHIHRLRVPTQPPVVSRESSMYSFPGPHHHSHIQTTSNNITLLGGATGSPYIVFISTSGMLCSFDIIIIYYMFLHT